MIPFPLHAPQDLVALGGDGDRTGADLRAAAAAVAAALSGRAESQVVLACDDRFHFAAGLLGSWSAGRLVVLPPSTQPATLEELAAGGCLLLHDRDEEPAGHDLREWVAHPAPGPLRLPGRDQDAVIVATSGSTGPSQRFPKTLRQLLEEVAVHGRLFHVGPAERILVTAPPHHIYGLLFGILLPLSSGAAFLRRTALHAEAVAEAVRRHGVTHVVSVPAHLRALVDAGPLPAVARVFSSGAPLPADTSARLAAAGWAVTEIFGSSETGGVAWRERAGAPWRTFPGVQAAVGAGGRLEVDGSFLHPSQPRPFVTGDLARAVPEGFELLGRADGVVKAGGKRVSLREIEERAAGIAGVSDAAALAQDVAGARGQEVWLAVAGRGVAPESLRRELARWLDPLAMPRRIRVVDALPREENGKLTRARLLTLFEGRPAPSQLDPDGETVRVDDAGREEVSLDFTIPPDLVWFEGHFPGRPVLAAVVQLQELVLRQARRRWPGLGSPRRVQRLKFKQVVTHGDRITLRLVHDAVARRVDFHLSRGRASCASGTLLFAPPSAETPT